MCWLLALLTFLCLILQFRVIWTINSSTLRELQWVAVKDLFIKVTQDCHTAALASEMVQVPSSSVLVSETLRFILTIMQGRKGLSRALCQFLQVVKLHFEKISLKSGIITQFLFKMNILNLKLLKV